MVVSSKRPLVSMSKRSIGSPLRHANVELFDLAREAVLLQMNPCLCDTELMQEPFADGDAAPDITEPKVSHTLVPMKKNLAAFLTKTNHKHNHLSFVS